VLCDPNVMRGVINVKTWLVLLHVEPRKDELVIVFAVEHTCS